MSANALGSTRKGSDGDGASAVKNPPFSVGHSWSRESGPVLHREALEPSEDSSCDAEYSGGERTSNSEVPAGERCVGKNSRTQNY